MDTDILVIGGGPIGLVAARTAAKHGARTLVLERRTEDAAPSCCTGLVSLRTLETLGVSKDSVLRSIQAARLHIPEHDPIELHSDGPKAVVIDRRILEEELRRLACASGAHLWFEAEAMGSTPEGDVLVRCSEETYDISASIVIGADGPRSQVARWFSLEPPAELIAASQVEIETSTPEDCVEIFFGEGMAPGFFAWGVPAQDGRLRVGVGVRAPHNPGTYLDHLLAAHYPRKPIVGRCAGWIPLPSTSNPAGRGALLVGDAAAHIKPLSGGGLYFGGACARVAGELAAQAAKAPSERDAVLAVYPDRCLDIVGKEQAFGRTLHEYAGCMANHVLAELADTLADPSLLKFVADHADIDRLHELPDRLAAEPRLWGTLLQALPLLVRHSSEVP